MSTSTNYSLSIFLLIIFCIVYDTGISQSREMTPSSTIDIQDTMLAPVQKGAKWGYINIKGRWIIGAYFDNALCFSEGLAPVKMKKKWGFIDKQNKLRIPFQYDSLAISFCEGLAGFSRGSKWGFVNKSGKEVIQPVFDEVKVFSEDLCAARKGKLWGFIDRQGKVVIDFRFKSAYTFCCGIAVVEVALGEYKFMDKKGEILTDYQPSIKLYEGLARKSFPDGKVGFIDSAHQTIIPPIFDDTRQFREGLAAAKQAGKWGFIDQSGQFVIPPVYHSALSFSDSLSAVSIENGKWNYINHRGEVVIQVDAAQADFFNGSISMIRYEKKAWKLIDKQGHLVSPYVFDFYAPIVYEFVPKNAGMELLSLELLSCADMKNVRKEQKGYYWVSQNKLFGLIDEKGNLLLPFSQQHVTYFN
ncbi:WG repeat-containing protein [Fluviicola sp.]|uniref:WG repeat-containing protein n=1 Tax=Fluviicola sp. TaxID=1917219 RepID=UPI0031E35359